MIGAAAGDPEQSAFLPELVRQFRAEEGGEWDGRTDFQLLEPLVHAGSGPEPEDEPDPDVFWRLELFHRAVGGSIERRTGVPCQVLLRMHREGFGLLVVVAGRLVVLSRKLRNVGGFGFASIEALAEAGERLVAEGAEMIDRFPEVARLDA